MRWGGPQNLSQRYGEVKILDPNETRIPNARSYSLKPVTTLLLRHAVQDCDCTKTIDSELLGFGLCASSRILKLKKKGTLSGKSIHFVVLFWLL
jgi:hypothetical protein